MTVIPTISQRVSHAEVTYKTFLRTIVAEGIFSDSERSRQSGMLKENEKKEITAGTRIDVRTPFLAAISGKGGWVADKGKAERYARFTNVSLLDHLCSVVRGALVFAEMDLTAFGVAGTELDRRLARIAAVAFLHDADKMLGLSRSEELTPEHVGILLKHYGVDRFLEQFAEWLEPDILIACIDEVEITRGGRLRPGAPIPPRDLVRDCAYVRLADRLDGKFLDTEEGGADAVIRQLADFDGLRTDVIKKTMRVVRIEDPHSTFLLDELQAALSDACLIRHGVRPLIELHHDGRLLCIVPEDGFDDVVSEALRLVVKPLKGEMRININNKGAIYLLDASAKLTELTNIVQLSEVKLREDLLRVKKDFAIRHRDGLDDLFASTSYLPIWPENLQNFGAQLVPPFRVPESEEGISAFLLDTQTIACVLCCTTAKDFQDSREVELCDLLKESLDLDLPSWLGEADNVSRRSVLAALSAAYARENRELWDKLLGLDGLAALWLEGRPGRKGLNDGIESSGLRLAAVVEQHFSALVRRKLVIAKDETAEGRCHFTNQPVGAEARIDLNTGLYAVKISAFSGREGRFESHENSKAETLLSPIAEAEHRLRQIRFGKPSTRREVAVQVSSPTTAGLFPALAFDGSGPDHFLLTKNLTFSDVLRRKRDGDKLTFSDLDGHERRLRIARYEEFPKRLVGVGNAPGQIAFIRRVFEVSRRTGRPVHLFRGLPRPTAAFVSFDALPSAVELMLEGLEFRLEQIDEKIELLEKLEAIAETTGFGLDLALAIGDPQSRFGAACDALARCERGAENDLRLQGIRSFLVNILEKSETLMSDIDRAIVAFGEAMAKVQRARNSSDGGNIPETGFRVALEAAENSVRIGQSSEDAIEAAVGGLLQDTLERRGLYARRDVRGGESLAEALNEAVKIFVRDVWFGAFIGKSPMMKRRRIAIASYRWAFERAARKHRNAQNIPDAA